MREIIVSVEIRDNSASDKPSIKQVKRFTEFQYNVSRVDGYVGREVNEMVNVLLDVLNEE